jgi:transposase-like protein
MPSRDAFFAALGSLPAAIALLTALRWPDALTCPYCGSADVGGHGRYHRGRDLPRYRCKAKPCRRTSLLTTGTPLARSRLPLPDSGCVRWLIVLGLPAWCAARETDRAYDRVYALMWRLIEAAIGRERDRRLSGTVEVDEIYVSSGHKGEPESSPNRQKPLAPPTLGRERGLRHGPGRGHADKDRPVAPGDQHGDAAQLPEAPSVSQKRARAAVSGASVPVAGLAAGAGPGTGVPAASELGARTGRVRGLATRSRAG